MANKQPNLQKCDKQKSKQQTSAKVVLPCVQNGDTDPDHVNGYGESSSADIEHTEIQHDVQIQHDEDASETTEKLINPNHNGFCIIPHNHEPFSDPYAISKGPVSQSSKKPVIKGDRQKVNSIPVSLSCEALTTKPGNKLKNYNAVCCDIFYGNPPNDGENEDHCSYTNTENHHLKLGWNDVNGGGMSGFANPSLVSESENDIERNYVSVAERLNVCELDGHVENDGRISRDTSDGGLSEMIDEGAVCDFDRLQLLEYEEMYEVDNLDIDNDHEFDELESPDLLFPHLVNNSDKTGDASYLNLTGPRHNSDQYHFNVTQHNYETVGAAAQFVSVVCYKTVRCEDHVIPDANLEDNGDFIDTDLPSKASGPNSSESFSGSDEDITCDPLGNIAPNHRNDLSGARTSYSFSRSRENYSPLFDTREKCLLINRGSNVDTNKDDCLYPTDKLHLISHDDSDNSSESENGDNLGEILFDPCVVGFEEHVSSDHLSSNHPQGAVGHFRRTCLEDYLDDHGINASGGDLLCEKVSNSTDLPMCSCPAVNSFCTTHSNGNTVNNLSSNGSQNSNLQNDESNKKQTNFNKFPILSSRQSCGSQAAQMTSSCNHLSCDKTPNLPCMSLSHGSNMSSLQQTQHLFVATNYEHLPSTSECGVSEPIYEDANECFEDDEDNSKMGASGGFTENFKNNIDSETKPKKTSRLRMRKLLGNDSKINSSITYKCHIEKVMIWSEYEAYIQQVKQIGTSACGPTAVINVLKALDSNIDKADVSRVIRAKLRMEDAPIPLYLFSRAVAGTEANDLLKGVEMLTHGKLHGRFFKFWPPREVHLVKWLGHWMKKGAVPLATLNLQRGVVSNQSIPDAWHHQMVYGVSSKDVYLTNPLDRVPEEIIMEQLTSDSILLINRQDVVKRFRDGSDLRHLLAQSDDRWCTMNVLGQVVNVLREESLVNVPGYRTQLTSHISIPAVYETGITFFVQSNTETWTELKSADELPLKQDA